MSARDDLLALTFDDLVLLANRGIARRAQQEMDSGELSLEAEDEGDGAIVVRWSDGATCRFPAGKPVKDASCTCPASTLCRHIVRSVLAYQRWVRASRDEGGSLPKPATPAPQPWDPGTIGDDSLAAKIPKTTLAKARRLLDGGYVADLVRSVRPIAHFHTFGCTVRFLVPGDPSYCHCDCAEGAPCVHVPLAVWAFRALDPHESSAVLSHGAAPAVPAAVLDDVETALRELVVAGLANAHGSLVDRFRRLERTCRDHGLAWPADALAELVGQHEAYAAHDARFWLARVVELVGELCARCDAVRAEPPSLPQLFVRGAPSDEGGELGSARLLGLGCDARKVKGGVELAAYLYGEDSGRVLTMTKVFPDPPEGYAGGPEALSRLAHRPAIKGVSLASLGSGHVLAKGGRRTSDGRLIPGRSPLGHTPQAYGWETLRAPLATASFDELAGRLSALPPAVLRPRRVAEDLVVCAVHSAELAAFDHASQEVKAVLVDPEGGKAMLVHPYTSRGHAGTEALLDVLRTSPEAVRYVAGHAHVRSGVLVVAPVSVVAQEGSNRRMLQPWVDERPSEGSGRDLDGPSGVAGRSDPLVAVAEEMHERLADLFLLGLQQSDASGLRAWQALRRRLVALGFTRLVDPVARLADSLDTRSHVARWDPTTAATAALELAVGSVVLRERVPWTT